MRSVCNCVGIAVAPVFAAKSPTLDALRKYDEDDESGGHHSCGDGEDDDDQRPHRYISVGIWPARFVVCVGE